MPISKKLFDHLIMERATGHQPAARVDTKTVAVGGARVTVREQGGYIVEALLKDASGRIVPLLFADADISRTKINASHSMIPAGPYDGLGGQHGFARWADYDVTVAGNVLSMTAQTPEGGLGIHKNIRLEPSTITIICQATNHGSQIIHTSIGEHLYFTLPGERSEGMLLGTDAPLAPIPEREAIMRGETVFWDTFDGRVVAEFPDGGKTISMYVTTTTADEHGARRPCKAPTGMLLWHRPGTESICLEPVVGSMSLPDNKHLEIEPGCTVIMRTTITLFAAH